MNWSRWVDAELAQTRNEGRWREIRTLDGRGPEFLLSDGRSVVSFASNDYLGLAGHPRVIAAAQDALARWGAGAGASRLVVGARPVHAELEAALAEWTGTERVLLFPTGYATNLGVMTTFGAGARIVSDELNHASIIDGARLARAEVCVYRHGDVDHAANLVKGAPGRVLIVSDTVFSMDGDLAPVEALADLCTRAGALLVLDDAHAVLGSPAVGAGAECLRIGTLSKALGSLGGYAAGPRAMIDLLINRARPFIFSTAPTPGATAAALAALEVVRSSEGARLRATLRYRVDAIRPGHPSPIIPVVLGDEAAALRESADLLDQGLLVPAIRPPTVPVGTSRLRIAISAAHTSSQVNRLAQALS